MNKNLVIKLLKSKDVSIKDVTQFVAEYIEEEKKTPPTKEQLQAAVQLVRHGVFNLHFALLRVAEKLNLTVVSITNKNNEVVRVDVYE